MCPAGGRLTGGDMGQIAKGQKSYLRSLWSRNFGQKNETASNGVSWTESVEAFLFFLKKNGLERLCRYILYVYTCF